MRRLRVWLDREVSAADSYERDRSYVYVELDVTPGDQGLDTPVHLDGRTYYLHTRVETVEDRESGDPFEVLHLGRQLAAPLRADETDWLDANLGEEGP